MATKPGYGKMCALLGMGIILLFCSCSKEVPSFDANDFMVHFGFIQKERSSEKNILTIKLDNGDLFIPETTPELLEKLDSCHRVLVNFTPGDEQLNEDSTSTFRGRINYIENIPLKPILRLSPGNKERIGRDPVMIRETWISGDSILNISFSYLSRGSLLQLNLINNDEGDGNLKPYILEFRREAESPRSFLRTSGYLSFQLNPLKKAGRDLVNFIVRYTDNEGRKIDLPHQITY